MSNTRIITCALAVAGVLLVGSQAMAQLPSPIYACVNDANGTINIAFQTVPCGQPVPGPAGPAGPQGPAGATGAQGSPGQALAGADFECKVPLTVDANQPFFFIHAPNASGSFGSSISTNGTQFSSIVLQPGIYQIHLDGNAFAVADNSATGISIISLSINGSVAGVGILWSTFVDKAGAFDIVGGDRLFAVTQANTVLQVVPPVNTSVGNCELVITRLQ